LARQIKEDYENACSLELVVLGVPQIVGLPFPCQEELTYDVIFYPNKNQGLRQMLGRHKQFHCTLSVGLVSMEKPKEEAIVNYRVVQDSNEDENHHDHNAGGGEDEDEHIE
jgi:hypothetical protein